MVLELLEQPVKAADISGLKYVTDRVNTPVMADESVFSPSQVMDLIQQRAADIINIKLMKTGGSSNAIRIADIAGIRRAVHDRLHDRIEHQRGCGRAPGRGQERCDHQG